MRDPSCNMRERIRRGFQSQFKLFKVERNKVNTLVCGGVIMDESKAEISDSDWLNIFAHKFNVKF